jgi:hypothetical protein
LEEQAKKDEEKDREKKLASRSAEEILGVDNDRSMDKSVNSSSK